MVFETFACRKKLASRNGKPDVYAYDVAPKHMRHQICMALREGIGHFRRFTGNEFNPVLQANAAWSEIDRTCRKEIESYLRPTSESNLATGYLNYLMSVVDIDDFLSALEIGCLTLRIYFGKSPQERGAVMRAEDALQSAIRATRSWLPMRTSADNPSRFEVCSCGDRKACFGALDRVYVRQGKPGVPNRASTLS
jgi:hypothetical protein